MKKTLYFFSMFTLLSGMLSAQVTDAEKALRSQTSADSVYGWKFSGLLSLNAANTFLVHWSAGGENSIGFESNAMLFANLRKPKFVWENSLNAAYGTMRQGDKTKDFMKTNDKLEFNSKYGQKAYKNFYYSALVNFKTQMFDGRKYINDSTYNIISRFFSPATLLAAIGMDYNPNANFSLFVSPLSARFTYVKDQTLANAGAFGVTPAVIDATNGAIITPGGHHFNEYGGYIRLMFKKSEWKYEILKNIMFVTKLDLFTNYAHKPQNVKVNWENQILFNVNKYLTFIFNNQYIYDDTVKIIDQDGNGTADVSTGQYKQITSIGISYKF
ncbi:MAG: DUF3078 domain-containing protein [Bacteroidales bacterium]|jgi:hypothetical protein|nr:DUF3078 domain-containing protein [Bacteroidales bacterium]